MKILNVLNIFKKTQKKNDENFDKRLSRLRKKMEIKSYSEELSSLSGEPLEELPETIKSIKVSKFRKEEEYNREKDKNWNLKELIRLRKWALVKRVMSLMPNMIASEVYKNNIDYKTGWAACVQR